MNNSSTTKKQEVSLSELAINPDQIEDENFDREMIMDLSLNGEPLGFFNVDELNLFLQHTHLSPDTIVRPYLSETWMKIYEHPRFQRRRPQIIRTKDKSSVDAKADQYFILKNGQKIGPLNTEEIKNKLEIKEFIMTDLISSSKEESWGKIYEIELFDRRKLSNDTPPPIPANDVISIAEEIISYDEQDGTNDAIVSLAFLGNRKQKEAKEVTVTEIVKTEIENKNINSQTKNKSKKYYFLFVLFIMVSAAGIGKILLDKNEVSPTATAQNKAKFKTSKMNSQKVSVAKRSARRLNTIKSIPSSKTITNRINTDRRRRETYSEARRKPFRDTASYRDSKRKRLRDSAIIDEEVLEDDLYEEEPEILEPIDEVESYANKEDEIADEEYPDDMDPEMASRARQRINEEGPDSEEDLFDQEEENF